MPQVPTYSPSAALTGSEVWHAVQVGGSVKITPDKIKTFVQYILPIANAGLLGGILDGTDITIDAFGNVTVNNDSHTHIWDNITNTPTTLLGYGITDATSGTHSHPWSEINSTPTTILGYGITDAASAITVATTAPASPDVADLWLNSTNPLNQELSIYFNGVWEPFVYKTEMADDTDGALTMDAGYF